MVRRLMYGKGAEQGRSLNRPAGMSRSVSRRCATVRENLRCGRAFCDAAADDDDDGEDEWVQCAAGWRQEGKQRSADRWEK